MKRPTLSRVLLLLAGLLLAIQLVPYGWNHTNRAVVAEPKWDTPRTRELFFRACSDCHSNETKWPLYSRVAPVSWLVYNDVQEGREHLNVSQWNRPQKDAHEAAEQLQKGEMPLPIYLPLHPEARLSAAEKAELVAGLTATLGDKGGREGGGKAAEDEDGD
ncbi:MAG: heme-binding domain-containing protein [Thermoanaerobaculia bacterium]